MIPKLHLSHYQRYTWQGPELLVVRGNFAEALTCRDLYNSHHKIPPAGEGAQQRDRMMAAAGLAAVALTERESWGWSLTLEGTELGLFCGVEPEGMICSVIRRASSDRAAVVLQRQKGNGPMVQSNFEPRSRGAVATVQEYFCQVEQIPTRVAVTAAWDATLVQPLPGGDLGVVADLEGDELVRRVDQAEADGQLKQAVEVLLFYDCRCDDEMMLRMLTTLPAQARADLWGDEPELRIECPRCGRDYTIQRGA